MARIVFAMLESYTSHLASALELAHQLKACRHEVVFVGKSQAAQERVEREGFSYLKFSADRHIRKLIVRRHASAALDALAADAVTILGDDVDLLVCDRFNFIASLLAHRLGKKYIFLQTSLPAADPKSSRFLTGASPEALSLLQGYLKSWRFIKAFLRLQKRAGKLLGFSGEDSLCLASGMNASLLCEDPYDFLKVTTIVSCPKPFDLPQRHPAHFFFSNTLRPQRAEEPFDWSVVNAQHLVLYISFGSFILRRSFPRLNKWLTKIIAAMGHWEGWHVIIAMGREYAPGSIGITPNNVTVLGACPQLAILERASAMVTHAGINSVVECICAGVPMITMPMFGDQFGNSGRVLHHGLGLPFDYRRESIQQLWKKVQEISGNPRYRQNLQRMRDACLADRPEANPVRLIESILDVEECDRNAMIHPRMPSHANGARGRQVLPSSSTAA